VSVRDLLSLAGSMYRDAPAALVCSGAAGVVVA
jgi:hypothetical protein